MTKEQNYDVVRGGVVMAIRGIERDLEKVVKNLDMYLPSIKASNMLEYDNVKKAIKQYEIALQDKIKSLLDEIAEQEQ